VWRALGPSKGASSRPLPDRWRTEAQRFAQQLWDRAANQPLGVGARRFTLLRLTPQGSLQIQPLTARKPRTISLTDLGWVLLAQHEASLHDAPHLDEGQVHRFRYLTGTPQGSTRFIDTGWALRLVDAWVALGEGVR